MIHKRKKKEKSESCFKFNAYCLSSKKNTVSNNSFSEKQKGGVNFKATCNLSTPFSGTFITRRHKENLRLFRMENFCCQNSATWKVFVFLPLKQKAVGNFGNEFFELLIISGVKLQILLRGFQLYIHISVVRPLSVPCPQT